MSNNPLALGAIEIQTKWSRYSGCVGAKGFVLTSPPVLTFDHVARHLEWQPKYYPHIISPSCSKEGANAPSLYSWCIFPPTGSTIRSILFRETNPASTITQVMPLLYADTSSSCSSILPSYPNSYASFLPSHPSLIQPCPTKAVTLMSLSFRVPPTHRLGPTVSPPDPCL